MKKSVTRCFVEAKGRMHCRPSQVWLISVVAILAGLVGGSTALLQPQSAARAPEVELFRKLARALSQGQTEAARQLALSDRNSALRLLRNLLVVQLEVALKLEEAKPLSPNMGEVIRLLWETVADEELKRLVDKVQSASEDKNPFEGESSELATLLALCWDAARASDGDAQIHLWRAALERAKSLGLELGEIVCLHRLARAEREKGDLVAAFSHLTQAQNLLARWDYPHRLAVVLNGLGIEASRLGLLDMAEQNFLSALELAKQLEDENLYGRTLNNLGALALQRGNYREAADYLQQAINLNRSLPRLINLGVLYTLLRDYENALRVYSEALEVAEKERNQKWLPLIWNNMGDLYRLQGNYDLALDCLQRALQIAEQNRDLAHIALALRTIGVIHTEREEFEQALDKFTQLSQICRELNDKAGEIHTLIRLGFLHGKKKQFNEALKVLEKATQEAESLNNLPILALALLNLGVAYEGAKEFDRALSVQEKALELWQQVGDEWMMAWSWKNIGDVWEKMGAVESGAERERRWQRAIDAYWRAVRLIERGRTRAGQETMQATFAQTASEPFYKLLNLLAALGRWEEAFEVSERMRAQGLLEVIQQAALLGRERFPKELSTEYREWQQRITELETQLATALVETPTHTERLQQLQQELTAVRNAFERWRYEQRSRRWQLLPVREQQLETGSWKKFPLPEDTLVLAYAVTEQRTWLFTLAREKGCWRLECHPLKVSQSQLTEDVQWLRENLTRRRPLGVTAQRLYAMLLAPAQKALRGKRRLIVLPDGPLYTLPFQVLQDESGIYLGERFAILYAPSLTTLWAVWERTKEGRERQPRWRWVGLGAPNLDSRFEPLPFARDEVKVMASLLAKNAPKASVRTFVGSEATEEVGLTALQESEWVHFATHAVLEPQRPLYSHLLLTPDAGHDGALRAYEVLDLGQVNARMVVLSACDTGLGKTLQGEGLLGLVWAFLAAGTETLVVSQWQVNDLSTAKLMVVFYRHLLRGSSPAQALQRAQQELLAQRLFRHPYHWAGFTVWGKGW